MKTSFSIAAVLLAASSAIASPVGPAVNGVLSGGSPSVPRAVQELQEEVRGDVKKRAGKP